MDVATELKGFAKDSVRLVKRCTKPDAKGEREREKEGRPLGASAPSRGACWIAARLPCCAPIGASLGLVMLLRTGRRERGGAFAPSLAVCARAMGARPIAVFVRGALPTPHPPSLPPPHPHPEFNKIATKTALGFVVMGFIGFFVKLIFIVSGGCVQWGAAVSLPCVSMCACVCLRTRTGVHAARHRAWRLVCFHTHTFFLPPPSANTAHQPDHRRRLRGQGLSAVEKRAF